jgi:hypothetical protein
MGACNSKSRIGDFRSYAMAASNTSSMAAPTNRDAAIDLTPDRANDTMTAERAQTSMLGC